MLEGICVLWLYCKCWEESSYCLEIQWASHEKPLWGVMVLLKSTAFCLVTFAGCPRALVQPQLHKGWHLSCCSHWKSIGTAQNLLILCLSLEVYMVAYRFHGQLCLCSIYGALNWRGLTCAGISLVEIFLLFEGTKICTSRFLSPVLSIWPKGLWVCEMDMKALNLWWKCCAFHRSVVWFE